MQIDGLIDVFRSVQKAATPAVWSQGVTITRAGVNVLLETHDAEELIVRLVQRGQAVSQRVKLFLLDAEWNCDCASDDDPCRHVAAVVIAAKQGMIEERKAGSATRPGSAHQAVRLEYRFRAVAGPKPLHWGTRVGLEPAESETLKTLVLDRVITAIGFEQKLTTSLTSHVGGVQAGRIEGPQVVASKIDFSIDLIVRPAPPGSAGYLDRQTLLSLCKALENSAHVFLDGEPIKCSSRLVGVQARLIDEGEGWRLQRYQSLNVQQKFNSGFVLVDGSLRPTEHTKLTPVETELLGKVSGQYFSPSESAVLVAEILPALGRKIPVEIMTTRLPKTFEGAPRLELKLDAETNTRLRVTAQLIYGRPNQEPLARVNDSRLQMIAKTEGPSGVVVLRDEAEERNLALRLAQELQLQVGRPIEFDGPAALDFVKRSAKWPRTGNGINRFSLREALRPRLENDGARFDVAFESASGGTVGRADTAAVFRAFREGHDSVPLLDDGWAPLPRDWLKRFGKRIEDMLASRENRAELPAYRLPELASLFDDVGQAAPSDLAKLKSRLDDFTGIPEYPLPDDLRADLRAYQKSGVNWLCFLRDTGLGGLLADDMGLGKTLQAICALRGKTLVIAPTSVLQNWANELAKFRPSLKTAIYYGAGRTLAAADVTLTTYAVARIDQDILVNQEWDTIVLDEAQTIKNPQSQISKAVHRFRGGFRISLSGTPVENRLDDLWSQFQFVNPQFLGSYESFQESFARPIGRGDADATRRLRIKVKPFILRRLKRQVAPELPARTETVLRCDLSENERNVYESVLAATRRDVVARLQEGGSIIKALEALLRLRQACCHMSLVPGQRGDASAKLQLLLDTLDESLSEGHRSLIFSQWTSYLDLIQTELQKKGIRFSRIDGSTQNRAELVSEFQTKDGPEVMLLSLKAGGVGLTLTAADHVFIMDPWWNPSVEDQAADRAHRIGQQNPVMIHRLIANETVEEKILALQQRKKDLAQSVLDGTVGGQESSGQGGQALSRADLLELLS